MAGTSAVPNADVCIGADAVNTGTVKCVGDVGSIPTSESDHFGPSHFGP